MNSLAEVISDARRKAKLSVRALADILGLLHGTLAKAEAGQGRIEPAKLAVLAKILDLDPSEMLILQELEYAIGPARGSWETALETYRKGKDAALAFVEFTGEDVGLTREEEDWVLGSPNVIKHNPFKKRIRMYLTSTISESRRSRKPTQAERFDRVRSMRLFNKSWDDTQRILLLWHRRQRDGFSGEPRRATPWKDVARRLGYRHTPQGCYEEHRRIRKDWEEVAQRFEEGRGLLEVVRELRRQRGLRPVEERDVGEASARGGERDG